MKHPVWGTILVIATVVLPTASVIMVCLGWVSWSYQILEVQPQAEEGTSIVVVKQSPGLLLERIAGQRESIRVYIRDSNLRNGWIAADGFPVHGYIHLENGFREYTEQHERRALLNEYHREAQKLQRKHQKMTEPEKK